MGKKHKKYGVASAGGRTASPEQLVGDATAAMEGGHFRKARDLYKQLCKEDGAKYLPGLIEANRRLARQLSEKGQVAEAQQVIAYLRTIAPASDLLCIDLDLALSGRDWARAFSGALEILNSGGAALEVAQRSLVADALVLAFPNLEECASQIPEPFRGELAAVLGGLRGVSESAFEQVQELIRPVPRQSIFGHWKMLIKGMVSFYSGDAVKAVALFGQLPPGTTPSSVALSFGLFLGEPFPSEIEECDAALASACQLAGLAAVVPALSSANQFWLKGRFAESYRQLKGVPGFPSESLDLLGTLSSFYFKACASFVRDQYWNYIGEFDRMVCAPGFGANPIEARMIFRMLGVEALRDFEHAPFEQLWRAYLKWTPKDDPLKPKMASLIFERVGAAYAQPCEDLYDYEPGEALLDGSQAIVLLKESIESDRSNLSAHFKLLDLYETLGQTANRNRLLDAMTRSFPQEKGVLLRAGRECLGRKVWVKGLGYLESAHELDRIDPAILQELVKGLTGMACQHYEKGALEKGRQSFVRAMAHGLENKADFDRGLAFMQSRQAVLEKIYGDAAAGESLLEAARRAGVAPAVLELFVHCYFRIFGSKDKKKASSLGGLGTGTLPTQPSERKELYLVFKYIRNREPGLDLKEETKFVRKCLVPAAEELFSEDEAAALIGLMSGDVAFKGVLKRLLDAAFNRDPLSPRFRFLALNGFAGGRVRPDQVEELQAILAEAIRRSDMDSVRLAENALNSVPRGIDPESFASPVEADDEDFEDFEEGGFADEVSEIISAFQSESKKEMENLTAAEFAAFRKKAIQEMPADLFDELFAGISPGQAKKTAKASAAKPEQPELF